MPLIPITESIAIDDAEIGLSFIHSSGPGGQNVNKVATAVQLRFPLFASPSLPEPVKARAGKLAGSRLTTEGEIVITASRHRTQQLNRDDAVERLVDLLKRATLVPKRRVATRPTYASTQKRLEGKTKRSTVKKLRSDKPNLD